MTAKEREDREAVRVEVRKDPTECSNWAYQRMRKVLFCDEELDPRMRHSQAVRR